MTTPQRALELAGEIEKSLYFGEFVDDAIQEASDCAAILRHYAEIMQAEPVAIFYGGNLCGKVDSKGWPEIPNWSELIIKPEPLK